MGSGMNAEGAKEIVDVMLTAFNNRDFENLLASMHEDVEIHIGSDVVLNGYGGAQNLFAEQFTFYDIHLSQYEIFSDGEKVAIEAVARVVYKQTLPGGIEANEQTADIPVTVIYDMRDGRIAKVEVIHGLSDVLRIVA